MDRSSTDNFIDLRRRPQVAAVTRELIRIIHAQGLQEGDQMPTQQELRQHQRFHNLTLNVAMRVLVAHGIVTRKQKVGTIVCDRNRIIPGLWRIGIGAGKLESNQAYYSQLLRLLQTHLKLWGAETTLFVQRDDAPDVGVVLSDFDHLKQAIGRKQLDAVISIPHLDGEDWQARRASGLELTHAGAWENAPAGAVIEQGQMVRDAVRRLVQEGCRCLGMVSQGGPCKGYSRFWESFLSTTAEMGLAGSQVCGLHGGSGPFGGWWTAMRLLELPVGRRPDGLIVIDDCVATGLSSALASNGGSYRPRLIVQTNRQAPMAFALPVISAEIDIEELAKQAVAELLGRLISPQLPMERIWVYPRLSHEVGWGFPSVLGDHQHDQVALHWATSEQSPAQ